MESKQNFGQLLNNQSSASISQQESIFTEIKMEDTTTRSADIQEKSGFLQSTEGVKTSAAPSVAECPEETTVAASVAECPEETTVAASVAECPEETTLALPVAEYTEETALAASVAECPEEITLAASVAECPEKTTGAASVAECPEKTTVAASVAECPEKTTVTASDAKCLEETTLSAPPFASLSTAEITPEAVASIMETSLLELKKRALATYEAKLQAIINQVRGMLTGQVENIIQAAGQNIKKNTGVDCGRQLNVMRVGFANQIMERVSSSLGVTWNSQFEVESDESCQSHSSDSDTCRKRSHSKNEKVSLPRKKSDSDTCRKRSHSKNEKVSLPRKKSDSDTCRKRSHSKNEKVSLPRKKCKTSLLEPSSSSGEDNRTSLLEPSSTSGAGNDVLHKSNSNTCRKRSRSENEEERLPRKKVKGLSSSPSYRSRRRPTSKQGQIVQREGPKWDPKRVKPDSQFMMGSWANKALGMGNMRGHLYVRHPEVFKYLCDSEDMTWLQQQKKIHRANSKLYMLLVEDITDLSRTDKYRDNPDFSKYICHGFKVPEWMRVKIKRTMHDQSQ